MNYTFCCELKFPSAAGVTNLMGCTCWSGSFTFLEGAHTFLYTEAKYFS